MTLHLENRLAKRKKRGNLRELPTPQSLIDFASNDYLGFSRSAELAASVFQEWEMHSNLNPLNGLGSTGSRLLTGNSTYALDLEDRIANFHGYEAGALFSCGYMANLGLLSAIADQECVIFFDAGVHASTHDAMRLSQAKAFPFKHNDLDHLEKRLNNCSATGDRFICIESIYSTDGSQAPLSDICQLAKQYGAHLIVDEAHAVGVSGSNGRGLIAKFHLTGQVFAQIATFGKALGTYGAIVLGSYLLKEALVNFARSYIYTTALPFQMLAAIKCSYDLFPLMEKERQHLQKLIRIFRDAYPGSSMTHIQSVPIKGNAAVKHAAQRVASLGFDVRPLLSPTVRQGDEVLRVCLHAFNTEKELTLLLNHLEPYRSGYDA